MKKAITSLACIMLFFIQTMYAQLSIESQRIYDSCVAHNPGNVSYAISNGVQIISTPDSNSFYLSWFPNGAIPQNTPLIVTLHGSKGNAFNEFKSWHTSAQSHNCGIVAIQYNKYTNMYDYLNGYFRDDTIYSYLNAALSSMAYPSNKALLHGFSLGAARTYAVIYNDMKSGHNYFCTTISNAGKIDLTYPLYADLDTMPNVFLGKHWNLFCGPPETLVGGAFDGLDFTQNWLQSKGAIVDIYIKDSLLGHNGFQLITSEPYKDTMLKKYLECFNNVTSTNGFQNENTITIQPNPFSSATILNSSDFLHDAILTVYDAMGNRVKELNNINGYTITLNREQLPSGLYWLRLSMDSKNWVITKFMICN